MIAEEFFRLVRGGIFHGSMSQPQVDGVNTILSAWPKKTDPRWIAYALATAFHETATTMEPIAEYGHGQGRPYGIPAGPFNHIYYGRGFIQLTWLHNYARAEKEILDSDLVRTPDNALIPSSAAAIMVRGMTDGWFTGLRLENYFPLDRPKVADWVNARRIINGIDCAAKIALYAQHFRDALEAGHYA